MHEGDATVQVSQPGCGLCRFALHRFSTLRVIKGFQSDFLFRFGKQTREEEKFGIVVPHVGSSCVGSLLSKRLFAVVLWRREGFTSSAEVHCAEMHWAEEHCAEVH